MNLQFSINTEIFQKLISFLKQKELTILFIVLSVISITSFTIFYSNGLGLAYNDARSHLDIGRRVVEGLKPGLAQLGSVWLPLPHILMIPTIWNDFMWHSGLSGALPSMVSFVAIGLLIYLFLKNLGVGILGRLVGVFVFAANLNILYLQSTAMTELLLLATMTAGAYELVKWAKSDNIFDLLKAAFWIMLSTLIRYDGWFLFLFAAALILFGVIKKRGYKTAEGVIIFFSTLAAFGIFLWLLWNLLIFKDALFFALGPYSARAQQQQMEEAGNLVTKGNLWLSVQFYLYALIYNSGAFTAILGLLGAAALWMDKRILGNIKLTSLVLLSPLLFNVIALYFGHSVLFIQGLSGNTWFNVRYGAMMIPSIAIFIGFLIDRVKSLRIVLIGLLLFVTFFSFTSFDAVTIDDARVGSSQKNVTEVSGWLKNNALNKEGFVLISAASHDAIIFSSGLSMSRFIHEGTGKYWESATTMPDQWARWIVMRTYDDNDQTWKTVSRVPGFKRYELVAKYPFADIYELQPQYLEDLNTEPVFGKQK